MTGPDVSAILRIIIQRLNDTRDLPEVTTEHLSALGDRVKGTSTRSTTRTGTPHGS